MVGASAGSARAAARRSAAVRAGTTAAKGVATRRQGADADVRGSIFARLLRFLREVVAELRKVIWPHRNQMVTYTIVVIVFVVFMVALVAGLDVLFARGVLGIFG
ncbi:preprotein translocase subunit SecE [Nakamurella sp. YIM 132087]|uniref:Protein translocase subunit SecE n=1 Tax=Nakamurella alba TaxID=2665158 RepID=A0A7K1FJY2_9ACTN|nr:preprotein translocase subunit SecE [Nakamurella alba]